jgi:hypothetical protein
VTKIDIHSDAKVMVSTILKNLEMRNTDISEINFEIGK